MKPIVTQIIRAAWQDRSHRVMTRWTGMLLLVALCGESSSVWAQEIEPPIRELYIPFEELDVILEGDPHRVFLERAEYEELVERARVRPIESAPRSLAVSAGAYEVTLEEGAARIRGSVELEVLEENVLLQHPLTIEGIGLQKVLLDGKPAPLTRNEAGVPVLLLRGKGKYQLTYEGSIGVDVTAARQTLRFRVPDSAVIESRLSVLGDVELKSGASVQQREVEADGSRTRFDLVTAPGVQHWVVSANQRRRGTESRFLVRSVLIDEVTQNDEKLHATMSVLPLSGAVDRLRLTVPVGFEVLRAEAPQVARWEQVEDSELGRVLVVTLTEPTEERWVLAVTLQGSRARATGGLTAESSRWRFPQLRVMDAVAEGSIISLWVDERLVPTNESLSDLLPINSAAVVRALPPSLLEVEPGAPRLRQTMAYYAPQGSFVWEANLVETPVSLASSVGAILTVGDRDLQLQGGLTLRSDGETRWEWIWEIPAGWSLNSLAESQGRSITLERIGRREDGGETYRVRDSSGLKAGESTVYDFRISATPEGWLSSWETRPVVVPEILIRDAVLERGAIGIIVQDDLDLTPISIGDSVPLLEGEKAAVGLQDLGTRLAYRFKGAANLVLEASRKLPRVTAERFALVDVRLGQVTLRHELHYRVERAAARKLEFSLPDWTPSEISIRGGAGVTINDVTRLEREGRRYWTVQLAEPAVGKTVLEVEFDLPWEFEEQGSFEVPDLSAEGVELQVGSMGIAGTPELEIVVATQARRVDDGELAASSLPTSRRLIGVFGNVGRALPLKLEAQRRRGLDLPIALVSKGSLVTQLDVAGTALTSASYELTSLGTSLEIGLPEGSHLWTAAYQGVLLKPQREGDRLLLSLPSEGIGQPGTLMLVFETSISRWERWGRVELAGPRLSVVTEPGLPATDIPQADLEWRVVAPEGYVLQERGGTLRAVDSRRAISGPEMLLGAVGGLFRPIPISLAVGRLSPQSMMMPAQEMMAPTDSAMPAPTAGGREWSEAKSEPAFDLPKMGAEVLDEAQLGALRDAEVPASPLLDAQTPAGELREEATNSAAMPGGFGGLGGGEQEQDAAKEDGRQLESTTPSETGASLGRLEGVRGLAIELGDDQGVRFQSLGESPTLELDVVSRPTAWVLGWLVTLTVLAIGGVLHRGQRRWRALWIAAAMAFGAVPPCLTSRLDAVMPIFAGSFLAAWGLILCEMVAAWCWRPLCRACCGCCGWIGGSATSTQKGSATSIGLWIGLILVACSATDNVLAQDTTQNQNASPSPISIEALRDLLLDEEGRVSIPDDVVIVPYDPEQPETIRQSSRVVVPYARYEQWWNQAYPDRPLDLEASAIQASIASAAYSTVLVDEESLTLEGVLAIEVVKEGAIVVPLALLGGTIEQATLDERPARLQAGDADAAANAALGPEGVLLQLEGKGRHELRVRIRYPVTRQGGWRQVAGRLPVGVASELAMTLPIAGTELRMSGLLDRGSWETTEPNESLTIALPTDGQVDLQWRSGQGSLEIDRALTVTSAATLDVREDGLQCVWSVSASFEGVERDAFTLSVPRDWRVESVLGEAVRSFDVQEEGERQRLEVRLVQAARGKADFAVRLTRRSTEWGSTFEFEAPYLQVRDAALESGEIEVRRGARLGIRTLIDDGVTRVSASDSTAATTQWADSYDPSVLKLIPFQTYRFVKPPFTLRLEVASLTPKIEVDWKAVLRVDRRETAVDALMKFQPGAAPVHRVELSWPKEYRLDRLTPAGLEWSTVDEGDRRRLVVNWLEGQEKPFELALFLRSERESLAEGEERLAIPRLMVHTAEKTRAEWAVVADPDWDVKFENLKGCESRGIGAIDWLRREQTSLARAALSVSDPEYSAEVVLKPRAARVTGRSITNVRMTSRAIEETTLVEWRISEAGIREVKLVLPEGWREARVDANLLRRKVFEPARGADGSERTGWVELTLELQDAVRGEYSVLLERDRPLSEDLGRIELVELVTGRTERRLLAIENVGRDELVVPEDSMVGLEEVERQQATWQTATAILGDSIARLFQAKEGEVAGLNLATLERRQVERKGARIGLAMTTLVVDDAGAYRAEVEFRVANSSEPVLELELPEGARLWTAIVAGEPVKVSRPDSSSERIVRLPLVKTAEGEGDYGVLIQYGGRISINDLGGQVRFPLIGKTNLAIELSQVRLYLPENRRWFDFDGTMGFVADEDSLAVGFQGYLLKRIQEAQQSLEGMGAYSAVRARVNLQQSRELLLQNSADASGLAMSNRMLLSEAERQVEAKLAENLTEEVDNRQRLNAWFGRQAVERSRNVISDLGRNFDDAVGGDLQAPMGPEFNESWIVGNGLIIAGKPGEVAPQQGDRFFRGRKAEAADGEETLRRSNDRARGQYESFSQGQRRPTQTLDFDTAPTGDSERDRLGRYQQQLFEQNALPVPMEPPADPAAAAEPSALGLSSGSGASNANAEGGPAVNGPVTTTGQATLGDALQGGWGSLTLEIPRRGQLYRFSTPRGDTEIVARSVPHAAVERSVILTVFVVVGLILAAMAREVVRHGRIRCLRHGGWAMVTAAIGIISLVIGGLHWGGLLLLALALVQGTIWLVRVLRRPSSICAS